MYDSHTHLTSEELLSSLDHILARFKKAGGVGILNVAFDLEVTETGAVIGEAVLEIEKADFDDNGTVNSIDYGQLAANFVQFDKTNSLCAAAAETYDIDGDGCVNAIEFSIVINYLGESYVLTEVN